MKNLNPKKKKIILYILGFLFLIGIVNSNNKEPENPDSNVASLFNSPDEETDKNPLDNKTIDEENVKEPEDKTDDNKETSVENKENILDEIKNIDDEDKSVTNQGTAIETANVLNVDANKDDSLNKENPQKEERPDEKEALEVPSESAKTTNFVPVDVLRVVDGDTIVVNLNGEERKVRFVLVDTPETKHPKKPIEYYGKEVSEFTKNSLESKTIYLEKDVSDTDRYNRLLRYIWLEVPEGEDFEKELKEKCFNAQLLLQGYANIATFPPDVKYIDYFKEYEKYARDNKIGLWGKENSAEVIEEQKETQENISHTNENINITEETANENIGNVCYIYKTGKKYHLNSSCSTKSKPKEMTIDQAINLGYEPCKKCAKP